MCMYFDFRVTHDLCILGLCNPVWEKSLCKKIIVFLLLIVITVAHYISIPCAV